MDNNNNNNNNNQGSMYSVNYNENYNPYTGQSSQPQQQAQPQQAQSQQQPQPQQVPQPVQPQSYQYNNYNAGYNNGAPGNNGYPGGPYKEYPMEKKPSSGMAIASMIVGITSIPFCIIGFILGPIAIVLAMLSKKDTGNTLSGFAIAGLSCGCVGLVFGLFYLLVFGATACVACSSVYYY